MKASPVSRQIRCFGGKKRAPSYKSTSILKLRAVLLGPCGGNQAGLPKSLHQQRCHLGSVQLGPSSVKDFQDDIASNDAFWKEWVDVSASGVPVASATFQTSTIHLNCAHSMELLPGCPRDCFYFRSRWSDVWKHCQSYHGLDIHNVSSFGGCVWGLTKMDVSGGKPTYAAVRQENICLYTLRSEALTDQH